MFWNIKIETKHDDGEKNINVYDEDHVNLKFIISKLIARYTNIDSFFDQAKSQYSVMYRTADITVTIMNDNTGFIHFYENSAVQAIKVSKYQLYLLKNI